LDVWLAWFFTAKADDFKKSTVYLSRLTLLSKLYAQPLCALMNDRDTQSLEKCLDCERVFPASRSADVACVEHRFYIGTHGRKLSLHRPDPAFDATLYACSLIGLHMPTREVYWRYSSCSFATTAHA
jgi:hypothetical protein